MDIAFRRRQYNFSQRLRRATFIQGRFQNSHRLFKYFGGKHHFGKKKFSNLILFAYNGHAAPRVIQYFERVFPFFQPCSDSA